MIIVGKCYQEIPKINLWRLKMNKKKNQKEIKNFILDLTDAILPENWPFDIPLLIQLETGQHQKDYDITPQEFPWYNSLLNYVSKKRFNSQTDSKFNFPIGINKNAMFIGAKIYDSDKNLVAQGKNRYEHLKEESEKKQELENQLAPLRKKFLGIKDKYLIDFNETQESLLKSYQPIKNKNTVYDTFSDIFMSGGGSTYNDKSLASLGAYSSVIDFEVLNCTLLLFEKNELKLLEESFEELSYLTPIHSLIHGQIKSKNNEKHKKNNKI